MRPFDYAEMTRRNIGFVTEAEQERLRRARVFVCGAGGMGGACLQSLARAGVGGFEIADFDCFELANLNRQVFATMETLGRPKTEVTAARLREINPNVEVEIHGAGWLASLGDILQRCKVVVNGMDDVAAGVQLYRAARDAGTTVIDAYSSTLPSLIVVAPGDPRPEERLGFPTRGVAPERFTPEMLAACKLAEIEHVLVHSSTADTLDLAIAGEIISGKRARISFAPMVITTGNLMAYAAVAAISGRPAPADCRGWFLNPHRGRIERPRSALVAALRRRIVRRFLASFR
ncbi:MAG: ThiF family adenylyltransferase [Candidatus Eisenbacteria bacterium]|uniref:ThiF family adenylyltransferase n=1 Tax=Eiseniibacteriota bacterium TaxID=2212470 RepID=A0A538SAJ6_UNCEI|nr:MAG: ThiF family adenylyltransferase [Candidatus Eisenbacteria bacterium]